MPTKRHAAEHSHAVVPDALRLNGTSPDCLISDAVTSAQDAEDHAVFFAQVEWKKYIIHYAYPTSEKTRPNLVNRSGF